MGFFSCPIEGCTRRAPPGRKMCAMHLQREKRGIDAAQAVRPRGPGKRALALREAADALRVAGMSDAADLVDNMRVWKRPAKPVVAPPQRIGVADPAVFAYLAPRVVSF